MNEMLAGSLDIVKGSNLEDEFEDGPVVVACDDENDLEDDWEDDYWDDEDEDDWGYDDDDWEDEFYDDDYD